MAQELNSDSEILKEIAPEEYKNIKLFSEDKHGDDFEMVIFSINKQSTAYINGLDLMESADYDDALYLKAMVKYAVLIDEQACYDWEMVNFSYKKQIKAKKTLQE